MPTKHPRLCIVLEPELFNRVRKLAEIKGVSMSSMVCELLRESLEIEEDLLFMKHLSYREAKMEDRKGVQDSRHDSKDI
ncbi:hypothetical protein [Thermodesulfatator atlanticus]|uniref:hypothetical protein n=1 Tax=Thermodesulfatator atlanticus TaxID=501497 RepID=UPI0003B4C98E|nr:hypothetical protein [Thermodesulfatator atlanticus]